MITPSIELARYQRMFHAACEALGSINEALGLDPDDGGAEPILDAITDLKESLATANQRGAQNDAQRDVDGKTRLIHPEKEHQISHQPLPRLGW